MVSNTSPRSALRPLPAPTTAAARRSLRVPTSAFQPQGEISPGKNALLHCTTAGFTPPRLDHKSFAELRPLALLGNAFYAQSASRGRLSGSCPSARSFAPRFLPTLGRPHAVALRFVRCDQLTVGLAPTRVRPYRAHVKKGRPRDRPKTSSLEELRPCTAAT